MLNYGLTDRWEAVGEFVVQHPRGARSQIADAALDLKGVLREGVLQEKSGPSLAAETSILLPSRGADEKRAGFEETAVLSHRAGPAVLHWNLGGGVEREASLPFAAWGLIAESPSYRAFRAVGELNGAAVRSETPDVSGLLGLIWEPGARGFALDAGWRRGLSAAAAKWSVTAGLTAAFSPAGRK